jgi:hypothetical protein
MPGLRNLFLRKWRYFLTAMKNAPPGRGGAGTVQDTQGDGLNRTFPKAKRSKAQRLPYDAFVSG